MSKTAKTVLWVVIIVVVVGVIWYVASRKPAPEEEKPIKIGLSIPMTGEVASYGEACLGGAELAVKEINDGGGINDRKIELVVEDDKCSSEGVTIINKLANIDKVTAIVGPLCSAAAGPGVPIAQEAGVPTITVGSAPDLPKAGDYIFRNYPSDAFQGKFAAEFVYNNLGKRKAAVLYVKNDWGQGIRNVFVEKFEQLNGEIVYDESVLQEARDIRTSITKAKNTNPDVLYFPVYPQVGAVGLRQIKELNLGMPIVGGDSFMAEEIVRLDEADGVIYIVAKTYNPQAFQDRIKQITGKNSNAFTPFFYDAVKILAEVMKKVGVDQKAIRDELAEISYTEGVSLPLIEFDGDGDLKSAEFEIRIIKNKQSLIYEPE